MRSTHLTRIRDMIASVEALVRVSHNELRLGTLPMRLPDTWCSTLCEGCRLVIALRCDFVVRLVVGLLIQVEKWAGSASHANRSAGLERAVLVGASLPLDCVHG